MPLMFFTRILRTNLRTAGIFRSRRLARRLRVNIDERIGHGRGAGFLDAAETDAADEVDVVGFEFRCLGPRASSSGRRPVRRPVKY
jgi:hypothetical protein